MAQSHFPVALVKGSIRGIGKQCAIQLAQAGFHVVINGRNSIEGIARQQDLVEELQSYGVDALACPGDIADLSQQQVYARESKDSLGTTGLFGEQRRYGSKNTRGHVGYHTG